MKRATDEYRIQLTGAVPAQATGEKTILLGWHDGIGVFAAWDIRRHSDQASSSPSMQIKEEALLDAHRRAFSVYIRSNGERAVAFRPEYLAEYATNSDAIHDESSASRSTIEMLNKVDELPEADIERIVSPSRRAVVATIKRRFREYDFRRRILGAYGYRCAMCGLQLNLVEAAHILPVADDESTDETSNGVALCSLHHAAFDRNLVSFDERYRIEVSSTEKDSLHEEKLDARLADFEGDLRDAIILPADGRDYPKQKYISRSRIVRNWSR